MKKKVIELLKDLPIMLIGSLILSVGVYFFEMPNNFSMGGVSAISIILSKFIPISAGTLLLIINTLLLIAGFIFIGKETGGKTVFCSFAYSGFTWLFERLFPLDGPLTDQPVLELAYAMLLIGIASAVLFYRDASSGGTDIIALILKKYTPISNVGNALLCTDFLIAGSSFFIFGIEIGLLSLLGLFAKAFLIDGVIENLSICKSFTIITENPEPIVDYILNVMKHSATSYDAVGEYTGANRKIIITLCFRSEAKKLKQVIKEFDKNAFVTVHSTSEIIGSGFRTR